MAGINIAKLDKRRTYILLEYGTSIISKMIQRFSQEFGPPRRVVPSHVLALVYEDKVWRVYESHFNPEPDADLPSGSRTYTLDKLKQVFPQTYYKGVVYPVRFNKRKLKDYLGQPYGLGDIAALMRASILNRNGKQSDRRGVICSEYLALCCKKICQYFDLKPHCITPAHWLRYLVENNIKPLS